MSIFHLALECHNFDIQASIYSKYIDVIIVDNLNIFCGDISRRCIDALFRLPMTQHRTTRFALSITGFATSREASIDVECMGKKSQALERMSKKLYGSDGIVVIFC